MCGIIGYVGNKNATDLLIEGLERLEYRGYDSIGISVINNGIINTEKTKGRVQYLSELINQKKNIIGNIGIGHTRWATHGEPSDINSHPHGNATLSIVHNGIVENYQRIKERMCRKGYVFESETDTECIAKCWDYYLNQKESVLESISKVMEKLEGSYALGMITTKQPDTIYAIRKDSPLVIGISDNENFIASDISALIKHTKRYYLLEENEIAIITKDSIEIVDSEDYLPISKEIHEAKWEQDAVEKAGHPHFMMKEICEQPQVFQSTTSCRIKNNDISFEFDGISDDVLKTIRNIHIVACGTAMHAGMIGKSLIEKFANIPVEVSIASEYRYGSPIYSEGTWILIISQSGETADSLAALRLAKQHNVKSMAIVNVIGSSIAREAEHVIQTIGGIEIAVASTKAYYMQLSILYLLAFKLAQINQLLTNEELQNLITQFQDIPIIATKLLEEKEHYQYLASKLQNLNNLFFIGRGLDYALSLEASLKMKEISYINCEAYASGELKHGTISLITENSHVIALATQSDVYEKSISNIKEIRARKAKILLIKNENISSDKDISEMNIDIPIENDLFAPLLAIIPLQLLAYYTAVLKGNDVDKPRNLAKSVTVE